MVKILIIDPDFDNFDFETFAQDRDKLEFKDTVLALSLLLGWNDTNQNWNRILSDADGRMLVSTSPTKSNQSNTSNASPTTTSSTILSENGDRKQFYIQNTGTVDVHLNFDASAATTNDFVLEPGATLIDDVYYGEIRAITASGTGSLVITEFE